MEMEVLFMASLLGKEQFLKEKKSVLYQLLNEVDIDLIVGKHRMEKLFIILLFLMKIQHFMLNGKK